jgi:hypothetical protein
VLPVFADLSSRYLVSEFFRGIANGTYPIRLQGLFVCLFVCLLFVGVVVVSAAAAVVVFDAGDLIINFQESLPTLLLASI